MSKTYKHINKYKLQEYWRNHTWWRPDGSPLPKDPNEPERGVWGFKYFCGRRDARSWYNISNRKCRRQVKALLRQGKYTEAKYLKPENVDWNIW